MENDEYDLWHYTTAEGLKGILSSQTLWVTDYRYLNDSSEFIYSKQIIRGSLIRYRLSKLNIQDHVEDRDNDDVENMEIKSSDEIIEDILKMC